MKFSYYLLIFLGLQTTYAYAHDANIAFFRIQQKDTVVEVQAEFPWSIRNALLKAFPELENSKSQEAYDSAFFKYVNANLKLINGDSILELISVKEVVHTGHSHQNNFVFMYKGTAFNSIANSMLFNVYNNQKNYHDILEGIAHLKFITSPSSSSFQIEPTSKMSLETTTPIVLIVLGFSGFAFLLWYKMKK